MCIVYRSCVRCACDLLDDCLLWKAYPRMRVHSVERGVIGRQVIDAKSEKACKMACYWHSCVAIDFRTAEPRHDEACYLHHKATDMHKQAVDDVMYTHYQYSNWCNKYRRDDSGTAHSWKLLR